MHDRYSSRHGHTSFGASRGRPYLFTLWALCLVLMGARVWAADSLEASVDRNRLAIGETLQLTISSKLDASLGISLFSLNTLDIDSPDVDALDKDFDILDRQQNYRVQFENNVNNSIVAWTYTLSPKRAGSLIIPAFSLDDKTSAPIPVEVTNAPVNPADSDLLVEMTLDKQTAYVGEQMLLTVKLLYSNELLDGQLAHPDVKGVLFRQLEKQKEYNQTRAGKRFEVVERQYAVFAEESGHLQIPPVKFSGRFVSRRFGRGHYETVASQPVSVDIKAPPAAFTGKTWLPAMGFSISEDYEPDTANLEVGESVTRTITLQGLGLESATLPPVDAATPDGVRLYPGQSETNEEIHAAGITGMRRQEYALIATRPGRFVLPEIRIPWWDVVNDEPRVAILPERVLQVSGSGVANPSSAAPTRAESEVNEETVVAPTRSNNQTVEAVETGWFWPLLSLFLTLVSIGLGCLAWHYRKLASREPRTPPQMRQTGVSLRKQWRRHERARFEAMTPCRFAGAYSGWLQKHLDHAETAAADEKVVSIRADLAALQQACFSKDGASDGSAIDLQKRLLELTDAWLARPPATSSGDTSLADTLYPR